MTPVLRRFLDDYRDQVVIAHAVPLKWRLPILALASAVFIALGIDALRTGHREAAIWIFFPLAAVLPVEIGLAAWRFANRSK
jgi:hypothetical protein